MAEWIKMGSAAGYVFKCSKCEERVMYKGQVPRGEPNDKCGYKRCPWCGDTMTGTRKGAIDYERLS